ncbi:type IV secretion system protein [Halomonas sp. 3D7M]|uniref:type IV secretion system protein n=1 Tax=Halomonas sp. 3D7M TaxID=2742617 RepID=UPI001865F1DA|nr:type IV secretion system protein [Halomonas sp. 3D7M]
MEIEIAGLFFDWIDDTMLPLLGGGVADLVTIVTAVAGPAVVLYFVVWAIRQINEERPYTELIWEFFRLSAIMSFGLNAGFFTGTVLPLLTSAPEAVAGAFSGGAGTTANVLDGMLTNISETISKMWENASFVKWNGVDINTFMNVVRASIVIGVMGGIYVAISLLVLFVAKLVVSVILALGPIFVVCAFFKSTRNYFSLWVNQLVNYMLLFALFSMLFSLQQALISDIVILDSEDLSLPDHKVLIIFVVYLVSIGTITVIPTLASSLSGGVGLNGVVGSTAGAASALLGKPAMFFARNRNTGSLGNNKISPNRRLG